MNSSTKRFINSLFKISERYKITYRIVKLPYYLHMMLIGLLLSDGSIERPTNTGAARLSVVFGLKNSPYLLHLFNLLEPYTNSPPDIASVYNKKTNSNNMVIKFKTVSLPVFIFYHNMFYAYDYTLKKYVKRLPLNIQSLITPVVLAHLIMGDGNFKIKDKIIRIYTNSFSKQEVQILAEVITKKLGIKTKTVHDRNGQYMITISKTQLKTVKLLIQRYMHDSMLYKLGVVYTPNTRKVESISFNYLKYIDEI